MGYIVSDKIVDPNQGGRIAGCFKDGALIRRIEVLPNNVIEFRSTEDTKLYEDFTLSKSAPGFAIRSISTEVSTFSGTVILILGGFDVNTSNSRVVTLVTDYKAQAPKYLTLPAGYAATQGEVGDTDEESYGYEEGDEAPKGEV